MHNMEDPYSILGVSPSAPLEEVTKAYRKLAKKYHPDLNPGDAAADQEMRRINSAYERIKTQKTGGVSYERANGTYGPQQRDGQGGGHTSRGGDPFGGFGGIFGDLFGDEWQQGGAGQRRPGTAAKQQALLYIQVRQYRDALRALSQIHERDAEWHFLSAIANGGAGNRVTALAHAQEAVRMEPGNAEYRRLLDQFQQGSFNYRQAGQAQGYDMEMMGRSLLQVMLWQTACWCCLRGGC